MKSQIPHDLLVDNEDRVGTRLIILVGDTSIFCNKKIGLSDDVKDGFVLFMEIH